MPIWNPWRGCHKYSEGCKYCYIHKGDSKRNVDTGKVVKTDKFFAPVERYRRGDKKGEYKIKAGETVYLCFSSDFLIEDADCWRKECWDMIKERKDLHFIFLTKRIDRFLECVPDDWGDGYDNVTVGCTVENQRQTDYRLSIFDRLPIKHKNIICQPLLEPITLSEHLDNVELVVVGGEADANGRSMDFEWVLNIREECVEKRVPFEFRQCSTNFIKDGKFFKLPTRLLMAQAKKQI